MVLTRMWVRTFAAGAPLCILLAGCGAGADPMEGFDPEAVPVADRYGGTAVLPLQYDPPTLNGLAAVDFETGWIHQGILSMPLVRYDDELEPRPWLAERWDTVRVASDTLELTFHLRRDVRWHDGVPTSAEDVRFTYALMRDPESGFPRSGFLAYWEPGVEVIDSFTVRFRLRPHADFLEFWSWDVLLPAHLLGDVPPAEFRNHPFGHRPVGNGPFRFVRRVPGQELVFEANPDFPEALGGRPHLDRIVFRVLPDATARLTELLTGGIDIEIVAPEHVERLRGARGIRLIDYGTWAWTQLVWNTGRPPFDDPRVRRALSLAIDRRALVDGVLHGYGEPGRWTVTPSHWQFDRSDAATNPRRDLDEARRLLAEAGWHDRDGDGILVDAHGRPLRFTLLSFRESGTHPQTMVVLQEQLRAAGADVRLRLLEEGSLMALVEGRLDEHGERIRDFDAFLTNWETGLRSDDAWFLHSRHRTDPLAVAGYADPRADSLMDVLAATLDREAAWPLWRAYEQMMLREAPVSVLFYQRRIAAISTRLQGVEVSALGPYLTAHRWWLAPQGRRR